MSICKWSRINLFWLNGYNLVMKKIIYTFIFLLPIILLSCSGSSNEAELKNQLEIAEQKKQE